MPAIDFSKVKGLDPIPAGSYAASIVKAEDGVSNNGNPKIDVQWKIEDGGEFDGRIIFEPLTFTEASMFRVKNTLRALGFPKDYKGDVTGDDLVGQSAQLIVDIETSQQLDEDGEPYPPRNRVKKVRPLS